MEECVFRRKDRRADGWIDKAEFSAVIMFSNNLIILFPLQPVTNINFPYRLAQLRESGVQFRIRQHFLPSKKPDAESSSIVVSLVTAAPILVLLAAGNIIGLLMLITEQFVHLYAFRTFSARIIR